MVLIETRQIEAGYDSVECSPIFAIRQSQTSGVVIENPLDDSSGPKLSGSSNDSSSPGRWSLPNRQKHTSQNRQGYQGTQGPSPNASSSNNLSPYTNDANIWSGIEMDIGPELSSSDHHPSASEQPSPATVNSSSTTSFATPSLDKSNVHCQGQYSNSLPELHSLPSLSGERLTTSSTVIMSTEGKSKCPESNVDQLADTMGMENPFDFSINWHEMQQRSQGNDALPTDQLNQIAEGMAWWQ